MAANASPETVDDAPVKDFAICALDILSGLCEGLGDVFQQLVNSSEANVNVVLQIVFSCVTDSLPETRQSAFSFVGELCKNVPSLLMPVVVNELLSAALANLSDEYPVVCNNACWAVGELVVKVRAVLSPLIFALMFNKSIFHFFFYCFFLNSCCGCYSGWW